MSRALVCGAGRVGGLIAADLAADPGIAVTVADVDEDATARIAAAAPVGTATADLTDSAALVRLAGEHDVVVVAVPGRIGLDVLRAAIEAGRPVADISFAPQDPGTLDEIARRRGVAAVVDCGVAPGLSNLLVGRAVAELDAARSVRILVGGLPVRRDWPWEYRAVFSPTDVVEEYTRPARIRRGGREVVLPALSEVELVDLPGVGTVEAFLTDGLRTLMRTTAVPDLIEKTLRWPGHADRVRALRDTGFFDETPVAVGGVDVSPRALTERLLFRAWERAPEDEEFTVLRVEVDGERGGEPRRIVWDLFDRTDPATGATSMARTTGFPCALVARMLTDGTWSTPGVHPPEILGRDAEITGRLLDGLASRGVRVVRDVVECRPA